jgi:hypothetical protein
MALLRKADASVVQRLHDKVGVLNVPSMFPQCSLNVPSMFPQCSMALLRKADTSVVQRLHDKVLNVP